MGRTRTAAALPMGKYTRPPLLDLPVRKVHFVDDVGRSRTFDFDDTDAAPTLVDDLVEASPKVRAPAVGGRASLRLHGRRGGQGDGTVLEGHLP